MKILEIVEHLLQSLDMSALYKPLGSSTVKAIGKDVSLPHADSLLLHAIFHRALVVKLKPDPTRHKNRWVDLPRLPIPDREYIKVILFLRATGLVEFDGELHATALRLTTRGEERARSEEPFRQWFGQPA